MGEYAIRKEDGQEVKIGTCESMYYIRFEDREKVKQLPNSLDAATCENLFWRLPFPDEDEVKIGEYKDHNRGLRLYSQDNPTQHYTEFGDPSTVEDPGTMQFHNGSGILINVKCYHGEKLPQNTEDVSFAWNGRSWFYELAFVKNTTEGLKPVVHCRHCRQMWRYTWEEILPFVQDSEMRKRLEEYAKTVKKTA